VKPLYKFAYQPYKWLLVIPALFLLTMGLGLVCTLTGMLFKSDAANVVAVFWSRLCCAIVPLKVRVRGRDNYSTGQSYVIVANHQSMADIPVLHGFLGLNIKWIMKKELERVPIFSTACKRLGCIYVDRKNHEAALASIRDARAHLSDKASVLFFAEGTRSRDGRVMPFKKGAFRFAHETGLPILPVTIKNSMEILPSDSLDLIPGQVEVIVHAPVHVRETAETGLMTTLDRTRRTIAAPLES